MGYARLKTFVGKSILWSIVLILFAPITFFTAVNTQMVIAGWQKSAYYSQKPSTEDECKQIRAGMDIPQVLGVINPKAEPFEEVLKPDRFTFWRERHTCVVELDPSTQRVVRAHLEDAPGWPPAISDNY